MNVSLINNNKLIIINIVCIQFFLTLIKNEFQDLIINDVFSYGD